MQLGARVCAQISAYHHYRSIDGNGKAELPTHDTRENLHVCASIMQIETWGHSLLKLVAEYPPWPVPSGSSSSLTSGPQVTVCYRNDNT